MENLTKDDIKITNIDQQMHDVSKIIFTKALVAKPVQSL